MLLRALLALAILAVVCATPNAAFGTKQYPTTIPALDTARKQHAQAILQCYEIPSHSIDAGVQGLNWLQIALLIPFLTIPS
eukprot:1797851-Rhodomonas_salina.1